MTKKEGNLLPKIRKLISENRYRVTEHARAQGKSRNIVLPDILSVLINGYHEKKKDKWEQQYNSWNYSIRGLSIDGRDCRIIVSLDPIGFIVITVIDLEKDKDA